LEKKADYSSDKRGEDDRPLLLQVAGGDEAAFTALIVRYRKRVFTHALTFTTRYEEAEELTQDIFIRIWQNRKSLETVDSFTDYLFILSRNHLISHLRKRVMEMAIPDPETLAEELLSPDLQLQTKELEELIIQGIAKMPSQQQAVFRLSRLDGLSYEEIASRLGISRSTVKWHIIAGLNMLKQYVRQYGIRLSLFISSLLLLTCQRK
jgi:RNA polymerase sigma-70 factor (ECF subfamily)